MPAIEDRDVEEIRAYGQLPNAEVEIVYRRARDTNAEFIGISIEMVPFSADRWFALSNPFQFWGQLAAAAWLPWLQSVRAITGQHARVHDVRSAEQD